MRNPYGWALLAAMWGVAALGALAADLPKYSALAALAAVALLVVAMLLAIVNSTPPAVSYETRRYGGPRR